MKRDEICGWCRVTNELIPMDQGGSIHTICPSCGSTGPVLSVSALKKAYMQLRYKNSVMLGALKEIAGTTTSTIDDANNMREAATYVINRYFSPRR